VAGNSIWNDIWEDIWSDIWADESAVVVTPGFRPVLLVKFREESEDEKRLRRIEQGIIFVEKIVEPVPEIRKSVKKKIDRLNDEIAYARRSDAAAKYIEDLNKKITRLEKQIAAKAKSLIDKQADQAQEESEITAIVADIANIVDIAYIAQRFMRWTINHFSG
jgi:aminopeptidase N